MASEKPDLGPAHLNPDSNADRPQSIGVETVFEAVDGLRFPIDKNTLMEQRGDQTINLTGDHPESLRVMLLRTDADTFMSLTDLVQQLEKAY